MTYALHTRLSLAGVFVGLSHGLFGAGNVVHSLDTVIQDPGSSEVRPTPGDGSGNPFLTATYADVSSGQGSVRLTLEATGLADGEFAVNWFLNLDPSLDPGFLSFSLFESSGVNFDSGNGSNPRKGADAFTNLNAAGGGQTSGGGEAGAFDVFFQFGVSNQNQGAERLEDDEYAIFDIAYSDPANPSIVLRASDFDHLSFQSTEGGARFASAAKIQGLADDGSTLVGADVFASNPIPEPAAVWLPSVIWVALLCRRRRPAGRLGGRDQAL